LFLLPGAAPAAWEYPGNQAELFDLPQYSSTDDPEGIASSSDGAGGLLAAAYDEAGSPSRIRVTRVGHDGTELWGQGGRAVPFTSGSLAQHSPVAITHDGAGGACVAYLESWSGYEIFRFAHFTATGAFDRSTAIDNPGTIGEYEHLCLKMLPLANGDILMVWTQRTPVAKLHAARFSPSGTLRWHTDVNQNYSHNDTVASNTQTSWDVSSDGFDGALVTWLRLEVGTPQIGAQRIDSSGARWWGNDGHLLWSGYTLDFHDPVVVGDVLGGAFVAMSHKGQLSVQHLDPWGNEMWPAGGVMIQDSFTPWWAQSTDPAITIDGASGFIAVHGNDHLFAQRVDYWGTLLWAGGVAVGPRAGRQTKADLASDGAQGAVLAWQDSYYSMPGQPWRALVGMRLGPGGSPLWGPTDLFIAWTVLDPHDVRVVPDGASGALCAFPCVDLTSGGEDLWALGVGPSGTVDVPPTSNALAAVHAWPNPFTSEIRLSVAGGVGAEPRIAVMDVLGRLVRVLPVDPSIRGARWDGTDATGRDLGAGVYWIRVDDQSGGGARRITRVR